MRWSLAAILIVASSALPVCGKPAEHPSTRQPAAAAPPPVASQQPKKTLADTIWDYSRTTGTAATSYAAAKAQPEVMSKLFCYCGCDVMDKMPSLLACFQSNHSVECSICQGEALFAFKLKKEGLSTADIQKQVDRNYSHLYPFTRDSGIFKRYKASVGHKF